MEGDAAHLHWKKEVLQTEDASNNMLGLNRLLTISSKPVSLQKCVNFSQSHNLPACPSFREALALSMCGKKNYRPAPELRRAIGKIFRSKDPQHDGACQRSGIRYLGLRSIPRLPQKQPRQHEGTDGDSSSRGRHDVPRSNVTRVQQ